MTVSFRISEEVRQKIESIAIANRRSLANVMEICLEHIVPKVEKEGITLISPRLNGKGVKVLKASELR